MKPYFKDEWVTQYCSDALTVLKGLESDSIDLLCTDPPYGISFMGKSWDKALPDINIWRECLRVLKPGSFAFVMSIPRQDCLSRMIISLEDAGFRTNFTPIYWAYASGFPKAQNIGKAVDKRKGTHPDKSREFAAYIKAEREKLGIGLTKADEYVCGGTTNYSWFEGRPAGQRLPRLAEYERIKELLRLDNQFDEFMGEAEREVIGKARWATLKEAPMTGADCSQENRIIRDITAPATSQAKALDGSYGGFQPKPAVEVIIVAMKPLSEKTFVDQALKNRKGITWLDDCRIPYESEPSTRMQRQHSQAGIEGGGFKDNHEQPTFNPSGRFPANLLVSDDVLNDGRVQKSGKAIRHKSGGKTFGGDNTKPPMADMGYGDSGSFSRYFDLDKWAQKTLPFLIVPKASKSEKNKGLDSIESQTVQRYSETGQGNTPQQTPRKPVLEHNFHPTVKPIKLMSYLITLGSREGDVVLDPFLGSGTTALACKLLGRKCIGIEIEEKYCEIAAKRCSQGVFNLEMNTKTTSKGGS